MSLRLYLDTSVISHLFHEDAPSRKADTEELFENAIAPGVYQAFVSPVVIDELGRTRDSLLRTRLLDVIRLHGLPVLPEAGEEVVLLAESYIRSGILPRKCAEDALHVAYATVYELDVLVTWNFRHLARAQTTIQVVQTNALMGYRRPLQLLTPLEVLQP